jgi:hypothetical protein
MAIESVSEIIEARKGRNEQGKRSYSRQFLIICTSKDDNVFTVTDSAALPLVNSTYPFDPTAICKSVEAQCNEPFAWTYTAEYDTDQPERDEEEPENDEPVITWSSEIYQEPVFKDHDEHAILNSAGDFYDPGPTRDAAHLIAKVSVNSRSIPSWVISYNNAVNSSSCTIDGLGVAAGLARCSRVDIGAKQYRGSVEFRTLSYEIHIHREGWELSPLDAGFNKSEGGERQKILLDGDQTEPTQPVLLDGSGGVLADPTPATAYFAGPFKIYHELPFSALPGIS